jgi:hypothetical protein
MSIDPENQELPYTDDGPTEDVDIEITEEDLGESLEDYEQQEEPEEEQPEEPEEVVEQEEPEEEEEAPKRRRSPEKRISELARKAAEAEQRAQSLEARLQKEAQLREQSEQAMMTHYRNNLSVTAMDLKQKLAEARSMMDNEKIDDLQYQFNKTMNDLEAVTNWEREQQNKASRPVEPAAPQPSQQQVSLEPRTANWIQKNSWFQPKSEDFDPEMHEEATLYARRVERRFRAEGRDDEIGSVDYFTEIDRHMRREFPDAFAAQATPTKRAPPMSRDSNAAPVQRTAPGQPPKKSTSIRLSADQRRMAHQMAQSGAYRNPNGSRMTDLEAEKYHAIYIMKTNKGAN